MIELCFIHICYLLLLVLLCVLLRWLLEAIFHARIQKTFEVVLICVLFFLQSVLRTVLRVLLFSVSLRQGNMKPYYHHPAKQSVSQFSGEGRVVRDVRADQKCGGEFY